MNISYNYDIDKEGYTLLKFVKNPLYIVFILKKINKNSWEWMEYTRGPKIDTLLKSKHKFINPCKGIMFLQILNIRGKEFYFHPSCIHISKKEYSITHPGEKQINTYLYGLSIIPKAPFSSSPPSSNIILFEEYEDNTQSLIQYFKQYFSIDFSNKLLAEINKQHKDGLFEQEKCLMYGKVISAPRYTATFTLDEKPIVYKYAGISRTSSGKVGKYLHKAIKMLTKLYNFDFNFAFVNIYNGDDNIGWHSDSEKSIYTDETGATTIVGINLGETRKVQFRRKYKVGKSPPTKIHSHNISHGDVYSMQRHTQLTHKHRACKGKSKRISITLRRMK